MGWNKGGYRGFDEGWNISNAANPFVTSIGGGPGASGGGTNTFTYTAANIGTAASSRRVIVMGAIASTGLTISSVTIQGIATTLAQSGTGQNLMWVASAVVPTGTTGDIVVVYSGGNFDNAPIRILTVNNDFLVSPIPTGAADHPTSATTASASVSTANGGFTLMFCQSYGAGGTWTVTSSDDPITETGRDNSNGRLSGFSNGTQTRTATTALSFSVATNLHVGLWNFR